MYREGTPQYEHHLKSYGGPEKFGYKDFIPQFTGEKFDADEWAEIFKQAGAKFAGPVGEHHDGFSMWDTKYSEWNSMKMGPKRDIVGELEKAIRRQDMKYMVAMHHAENWWFYPHWRKEFDTSDPRYAGLYGESHNPDGQIGEDWFFNQDLPSLAFLDVWRNKLTEVVESYSPDMLWFDFGLMGVAEQYKLDFLSYYYNKETEWNKEVLVTYKDNHLVPNVALLDFELGRETDMANYEWLTDSTVDDGCAWGYVSDAGYKTSETLINYLIDNVSKNGNLLLNVGPKADGTIPDEARMVLNEIGKWLEVNGEAIYGTTPWFISGEGPTRLEKAGSFNETQKIHYTPEDIRFTSKDDALYAICLAWPGESVTIRSLKGLRIYPGEVQSVMMLGSDQPLSWKQTEEGLLIQTPKKRPCENAFSFKITRGKPYT